LTWLTTETSFSRLQMVERPNNGTSINNLWPSELSTTTSHGISRTLVRPMICRSGVQIPDGGNYSNIQVIRLEHSLTSEIALEF
jgi:hypothetical protein